MWKGGRGLVRLQGKRCPGAVAASANINITTKKHCRGACTHEGAGGSWLDKAIHAAVEAQLPWHWPTT
jgi:hypothetical protein